MRTLGIVVAVVVVLGALLWWWGSRASERDRDKNLISWWGTRNGWRYTTGSDGLLDRFRGTPFDQGTSHDVQDLLSGNTIAGRPGLLMQFSWYYTPDLPQSSSTGSSGLRSGICAAAVVELPSALPALTVRRSAPEDVVRGHGIEFESGRFNERFRVQGEDRKFASDVVTPQVMELLLDDPEPPHFRIDGATLVVWRDGKVSAPPELGALADFAGRLLELIPAFALEGGGPGDGPISTAPPALLGESPSGAIAFLQKLDHRGYHLERYEHVTTLWRQHRWAVCVKIDVPTTWPECMTVPKALAPPGMIARFDDEYLTGDPAYDALFATGTPRPDFAKVVLTPPMTAFLTNDKRAQRAHFIFQSARQAQLCVMTYGRLTDQSLADTLTDLACDVHEHLSPQALTFRK
ncbi:hypothetical protein ACQHIV_23400 [Kribbella sp. GL6]|uniref:hypothetical protein n=1 Tax=Kribbella sp. GL6 TaxID=3419765 RepID=UPI003D094D93